MDAIEMDKDQCMKCGRKEGHMASQCTNGVPKCDKCYHRHWAVDTCQEFKERMAARECYTCGEKGHVARKCKKPASSKQKTAYEISACLVGSEMCIRDRVHLDVLPWIEGGHVPGLLMTLQAISLVVGVWAAV